MVGAPIVVGGSTGSEVLNNYIHDIEKRAGIEANGLNSRVAGNYIYKTNKGISVSGTNMLVENNEIERLIDAGLMRIISGFRKTISSGQLYAWHQA